LETYDWNSKLTYLKNTRDLYYNDDYVSFLVNTVWRITKPVHIVDYGCGYWLFRLNINAITSKRIKVYRH